MREGQLPEVRQFGTLERVPCVSVPALWRVMPRSQMSEGPKVTMPGPCPSSLRPAEYPWASPFCFLECILSSLGKVGVVIDLSSEVEVNQRSDLEAKALT